MAIAAIAAFLPAIGNGFVLDDHVLIEQSEVIRTPANLGPIWLGSFWGAERSVAYYRPLVTQSYALNFLVGGLAPVGYHAVNLLLHALAALLVHRMARRWLGGEAAAAVAGLLFAVHPLAAESVSSVYGRTDLMATVFVLAGILLHLRKGSPGPARVAGAAVLYFAALLSKESVLLFPLVLVAGDAFRGLRERSAHAPPVGSVLSAVRARLPVYLVLAAVAAAYLGLRYLALGGLISDEVEFLHNPLVRSDAMDRLRTAPLVLVRYLQLWLFPLHLSPDYSYNELPIATSWVDPRFLYCSVLCVGFVALGIWTVRRAHRAFLGWSLFVIFYLLVSNAFLPIGALLAERFLYTPMIGLCLMAASFLGPSIDSSAGRTARAPAVVAGLVLVALGVASYRRAPVWRDDESVARAVIASTPRSAVGYNNLGMVILADNPLPGSSRLREATQLFARALEVYPEYDHALLSLGALLLREGRAADALPFLDRLEGIRPDYPGLQWTLGIACFHLRRDPEALDHLARAAEQHPDDANFLNEYGVVLETLGQDARAHDVLLRASVLGGETPNVLFNLATVEIKLGLYGAASGRIDQLLERNPRDAGVHVLRGRLLQGLNDPAGAEAALRDAVTLDPELAEGWYRLGLLLANDRPEEAASAMARATELGHEAAISAPRSP